MNEVFLSLVNNDAQAALRALGEYNLRQYLTERNNVHTCMLAADIFDHAEEAAYARRIYRLLIDAGDSYFKQRADARAAL